MSDCFFCITCQFFARKSLTQDRILYLVPVRVRARQLCGRGDDVIVVVSLLAHEQEDVRLDQAPEDLLSSFVVEVNNLR